MSTTSNRSRGSTGRRAFVQGFKRNLRLFIKSKIGVIGLAIIVFFVVLATFAPFITQNDPVFGYNVSAPYSVPEWATIIPRYQNLAVTSYPVDSNSFKSQADVSAWNYTGGHFSVAAAPTAGPPGNLTKYTGSLLVNASTTASQIEQTNQYLPGGQPVFAMSKSFSYSTKPPTNFVISAFIDPLVMKNVSAVYVNFLMQTPTKNFSFSSVDAFALRNEIQITSGQFGQWRNVTVPSGLLPLSGLPGFSQSSSAAQVILNQPGTYRFTLEVDVVPTGNNVQTSFYLTGITFHILGGAYGLLGTDIYGRDLWSQFVWGSQISLAIGVLSALGAVGIGTVTGLVAGYLGGGSDEVISRATDFVLVLPFLPLAIVIISLLGQNPALYKNIYSWVIALFVALSWPGITRIIRSQVLSVKERPYVEASRALGAGPGHVIRRHILPNVMGLVYSQTALNVSGFIILEAALDFLAVGIHPINTVTWGLTLTNALSDALTNSTVDYAWWWFLPPGIAIAALSLAFVLVGFALDRIFNPRLRTR
ncbi:MAG: ABC transporter permease [Thaumarchaeota archaeon]|nr:ABC transporter permease [Nitrososphaerota archaeon]